MSIVLAHITTLIKAITNHKKDVTDEKKIGSTIHYVRDRLHWLLRTDIFADDIFAGEKRVAKTDNLHRHRTVPSNSS